MAAAAARSPVRLPAWRARVVLAALVVAFGALLARAVQLQTVQTEFLQGKGEARFSRVLEVQATRGRILDRDGEALAVSTPVQSVWAVPGDVETDAAQRRRLAALLNINSHELAKRLADTSREFVYLRRQVSPDVAEHIEALGIPGVYQHPEYRRYYPGGEVTAHVVGFTGVDDAGQEGVELAYQDRLGGKTGSRRVIKDRLGRIVEDVESIRPAQEGDDVVLSLNAKIQSLAFAALRDAVEQHRARAGALVALDVRSGEILALANVPTYNPNRRAGLTGEQLRNRALTDVFEPGSTLKPLTIALALETGRVAPTTRVDTASGRLTLANYTIHDTHPAKSLSVAEVIQKSSNVGAAKIALTIPRQTMWDFFRRVGFGTAPQLDFPGEAAGKLRDYRGWRPVEQATMAYGHGISVSLVQLARAYTVFARDGELVPLTLTRAAGAARGEPVVSPQTARAVRAMLELAVQPGGTAPRARVMGWRVAGKTGTTHKLENGQYAAQKYVASFVGLAPVSEPRLVVAVMIDEPSAGAYYGGVVAAPVFAQVVQGALRLLGAPHDAPLERPADAEAVAEST